MRPGTRAFGKLPWSGTSGVPRIVHFVVGPRAWLPGAGQGCSAMGTRGVRSMILFLTSNRCRNHGHQNPCPHVHPIGDP